MYKSGGSETELDLALIRRMSGMQVTNCWLVRNNRE